jgi:hypothetical protein
MKPIFQNKAWKFTFFFQNQSHAYKLPNGVSIRTDMRQHKRTL